jgi:hypothetical protein
VATASPTTSLSFRKVGLTNTSHGCSEFEGAVGANRLLVHGVIQAALFGQCGDVPATMAGKQLRLTVLDGELAVARLPIGTPTPAWASEFHPPLTTMTRTADEVSLVGPAGLALPDNAKVIARTHACWRCTRSLLHSIKTSRSCASLEYFSGQLHDVLEAAA